ncbi:MAG: DUF4296 domain-containing protein [Spirosomataceae bacterium]
MKQVLFYTFLWIGLLLSACQAEPEIPKGTISEAKMAQILADIHLLEARIGRLNLTSLDSSTIVTEHLKQKIFKKYATDSATYNRSYQFYSTNPLFLERIYADVVKQLEIRQKKKNYKGI